MSYVDLWSWGKEARDFQISSDYIFSTEVLAIKYSDFVIHAG
jgi:hypothetical protein